MADCLTIKAKNQADAGLGQGMEERVCENPLQFLTPFYQSALELMLSQNIAEPQVEVNQQLSVNLPSLRPKPSEKPGEQPKVGSTTANCPNSKANEANAISSSESEPDQIPQAR